jgi:copper chaperone CopZ
MSTITITGAPLTARYRVTGMDCPSCVAKVEKAARGVGDVDEVKVSIASQIMTLRLDDGGARLPEVERAVTASATSSTGWISRKS